MTEPRLMVPSSLIIGTRQAFKADARTALDTKPIRLVLDFNDCRYVDSPGLGTLLSISRYAKSVKAIVRLVNCDKDMLQLLELTKMDELFEIHRP